MLAVVAGKPSICQHAGTIREALPMATLLIRNIGDDLHIRLKAQAAAHRR
ncbi:FitA-like ribbon-helix-helix domain-containing protein [Rhodopila globiformis]|nr:hypothetical protein [Rhodopila globiformis]